MTQPFSAFPPGECRTRAGLARAGTWIALALQDGDDYVGDTATWASTEVGACANALHRLQGFVGVDDLPGLLAILPPSVSTTLQFSTVYDRSVELTLGGLGDEEREAPSEERAIAYARRALALTPADRVPTSIASGLLMALNQSRYLVDVEELERVREEGRVAIDTHAAIVMEGLTGSWRPITPKTATYAERSQDPRWEAAYKALRRADVVQQRAKALLDTFRYAEIAGGRSVAQPTWRFHKHWTFAASAPPLNTMPTELRRAVPAMPGCLWVGLALQHPYVNHAWATSPTELSRTLVEGEYAADVFSQDHGFSTAAGWDPILKLRSTEDEQQAVGTAVNEIDAWALLQAATWLRNEGGAVLWCLGGIYFQIPREARLFDFVSHLHQTLVAPPIVRTWRARGAMHWIVGAGRTWGAVRPLNADPTLWPAELGML